MTKYITGGVVRFEDGVKSAEEYSPPRKAAVELRFSLPEGDLGGVDALAEVSAIAVAKVAELLGGKVNKPTGSSTTTEATPKPKPKTPPAAPPAPAEKPAETNAAPPEADAWETPPAEEPKVISDADLNAACSNAAQRLGGPDKVKAVIAEFNTEKRTPFKVNDIPADERSSFISKLEALS
jgi:hypothetical protein